MWPKAEKESQVLAPNGRVRKKDLQYRVTRHDPRMGGLFHHHLLKEEKSVCLAFGQYNEKVKIFGLIHIGVPQAHRGKGYGMQMLELLQKSFKMIYSGFEDSTDEGIGLLTKMGFERKIFPAPSGDMDVLLWRETEPKILMPRKKKIIIPKLKIITGGKK